MSSCRSPQPAQDTANADTIASAWAVPPRDTNLTCTPDVGPNDTIRMRMSLPHGASFHISDPAGTPFIVVFYGEGERDRAARKSLMPPDSFVKVTALDLVPRDLEAGRWVFGHDTNEVVFTRAGTYRFRVGSDMETDGPVYAECLVRYRP